MTALYRLTHRAVVQIAILIGVLRSSAVRCFVMPRSSLSLSRRRTPLACARAQLVSQHGRASQPSRATVQHARTDRHACMHGPCFISTYSTSYHLRSLVARTHLRKHAATSAAVQHARTDRHACMHGACFISTYSTSYHLRSLVARTHLRKHAATSAAGACPDAGRAVYATRITARLQPHRSRDCVALAPPILACSQHAAVPRASMLRYEEAAVRGSCPQFRRRKRCSVPSHRRASHQYACHRPTRDIC